MRAILREFLTGLGGPAAPLRRLRVAAWVVVLFAVPAILLPAGIGLWSFEAQAYHRIARQVLTAWTALAASVLLANVLLLAFCRSQDASSRTPPLARALTVWTLFGVLVTNHCSTYAAGMLASAGAIYNVLLIAIYRVFLDFRLGLAATALSTLLFAAGTSMELFGVLPKAPLQPAGTLPPPYSDTSASLTVLYEVTAGSWLLFWAVNFGVNQSVKLHRYITESVLRRYLPPSLVERASRGELRLDAEPERRVVTVLFTDLVGFTSLSERLGPDAVGRLLNRYLTRIADIAHAHGATVDKFIGDAVMIVFGTPDPLEPAEQARRCVALARELQASLPDLEPELRLQARAGINTGEAVVGNFGSLSRSDFTVIGPAVNIAARLETASQPGRILVGEATARLLPPEVLLEDAGELSLKGVSHPVHAYFVA